MGIFVALLVLVFCAVVMRLLILLNLFFWTLGFTGSALAGGGEISYRLRGELAELRLSSSTVEISVFFAS